MKKTDRNHHRMDSLPRDRRRRRRQRHVHRRPGRDPRTACGSTLTVAGGGGTDTLTADDSGTGFPATRPDPGRFTYTVNDRAVVRQSGSPPTAASSRVIHYTGLEGLTLLGSAG